MKRTTTKKPSRERITAERLAQCLAREIFKTGDQPESPCRRIQFMGGSWFHGEKDQGGLCESALQKVIEEKLIQWGCPRSSRTIKETTK